MTSTTVPRLLCIMGSGETAPTMVSVHAELMQRVGSPPAPAVMLDTPFGFQENADDISGRALEYFRHHVGAPISIATFRSREAASPRMYETMLAAVADARYVFAGPGSPTYALQQWRDTALPSLLRRRLREGCCITFASAAAVGLGRFALPVYEVYKVGAAPHWNEGLDLLVEATGLAACVIPHYNNTEGGSHDTRYCYMGERRLQLLETMLPEDVSILGVDEHTACIFDLDAATFTVRGRGAVTWRRRGHARRFDAGAPVPVTALAAEGEYVPVVSTTAATVPPVASNGTASPFMEEVGRQAAIADSALVRGDVETAVDAMLAVESQISDWAADTLDSDQQDRARAVLRRQLIRLGSVAQQQGADPRDRLAPIVDGLLELRQDLRRDGAYQVADRLRDLLAGAGIEVRDTVEGSVWELPGRDG